jgi:hypothetical protein
MSVYCCKRIFRYRLSPKTFGYTLVYYRHSFSNEFINLYNNISVNCIGYVLLNESVVVNDELEGM